MPETNPSTGMFFEKSHQYTFTFQLFSSHGEIHSSIFQCWKYPVIFTINPDQRSHCLTGVL